MPVDNENSTAIRSAMNGMLFDRDRAIDTMERTNHLIMVARDVDNPGAFPCFAENFLDDVVVLLRPVTASTHLPDINEVAHDIKRVEIVFAQEIQQPVSPARTRSQMHIRNPGRSHASRDRRKSEPRWGEGLCHYRTATTEESR